MTAPIEITIGGTVIPCWEELSLNIDNILGQTIDTAKLTIYDRDANMNIPELADVIITHTGTGKRLFGGLSSVVEGTTAGLARKWDVQCQDYTMLLDAGLVHNSYRIAFTYDGMSGDKAIIAHLFEKAGVTLLGQGPSEIEARQYVGQAFDEMGALYFSYNTYREAIQTIAGYTGWNYHVDYHKHLHYYFRDNNPAPYCLSSTPGPGNVCYRKLRWRRDGTAVRNHYMMFGANLYSDTLPYYLPSDGIRTTLTLGIEDIGVNRMLCAPPGEKHIIVSINTGTDLNPYWERIEVDNAVSGNLDRVDCIFNPVEKTLVFNDPPPNLTAAVLVEAVHTWQAGQGDAHNESIAKYGRTLSRRLTAGDINSAYALNKKLHNYKEQFAFALEKVTLTVDDISYPGPERFEAGQWVILNNNVLNLDRYYLIHRVSTHLIGGEYLEYELELRSWVSDNSN